MDRIIKLEEVLLTMKQLFCACNSVLTNQSSILMVGFLLVSGWCQVLMTVPSVYNSQLQQLLMWLRIPELVVFNREYIFSLLHLISQYILVRLSFGGSICYTLNITILKFGDNPKRKILAQYQVTGGLKSVLHFSYYQ